MGSRIVNGFFEFPGLSFPEVINQDFLSKGRRGERSHISVVGKTVLIFGRKNETVILNYRTDLTTMLLSWLEPGWAECETHVIKN